MFDELEEQIRGSLNAAEDKAHARRRAHDDRRHPADAQRAAPARAGAQREPPLRAAQRADLRRPRRGPAPRDRRRRAAQRLRRLDRPRGRVHERAAAPARPSRRLRRALERGPGDRRHPARGRRELAVLLRQGAVAGDAHRAVRAGDGHAAGGAQGAGRAPARVVRRALDHVDLRPVRGERPLLPGAAPAVRRRGPGRGARARRHADARASSSSTTAPSTAGTGRSTRSCAGARTCAWRTACCRPARRSSTCSPTPPSTTGSCARWWRASGRSGRRCPSPPRRTTCTRARATASTRASTGPASATSRSPSSCCAACSRSRTRGSRSYGIDPHARDRLLGIIERRCVEEANGASWQSRTFRRLYEQDGRDRLDALREMTVRYRDNMHSNEPAHTWA